MNLTVLQETVPTDIMTVSKVDNLIATTAQPVTLLPTKEETFRTKSTKDIKRKSTVNTTTRNILNWLKNTTTTTTTNTTTAATATTATVIITPVSTDKKTIDTNSYEKNLKSETTLCPDKECTCSRQKLKKSTRNKYITNVSHKNNNKKNNNASTYSNLLVSDSPSRLNRINTPDEGLREFCGVQTLRRFWNKRIIANKNSSLRGKTFAAGHFTKSVDCLINSSESPSSLATEVPSSRLSQSELNEHSLSRTTRRKVRTQSLHECSPLEEPAQCESLESLNPILTDVDFRIHLTKDNFYKYKTAEQAAKLRKQSERKAKRKSEHIKKDDTKIMLDSKMQLNSSETWLQGQQQTNCPKHSLSTEYTTDMAINELDTDNGQGDGISSNASIATMSTLITNITTPTNTPLNTSIISTGNDHQTICLHNEKLEELPITLDSQVDFANNGETRLRTNLTTPHSQCTKGNRQQSSVRLKFNNICNNNNNNNQIISNDLTKKSNNSPNRCFNAKRSTASATTRKYSFKTHARSSPRSFSHATRKMILNSTNNDSSKVSQLCQLPTSTLSTSTSATISAGGINHQISLVAQLTKQFNEIIRKDNSLLNDVKRKNGILMTRGGHVYKVIQTSTLSNKLSDNHHYVDLSNSTSHEKEGNGGKQLKLQQQHFQRNRKASPSNVQRTIKKFERCKLSNTENVKPKVPAKSFQVLQKQSEIVLSRQQLGTHIKETKKVNRNDALQDSKIERKEEINSSASATDNNDDSFNKERHEMNHLYHDHRNNVDKSNQRKIILIEQNLEDSKGEKEDNTEKQMDLKNLEVSSAYIKGNVVENDVKPETSEIYEESENMPFLKCLQEDVVQKIDSMLEMPCNKMFKDEEDENDEKNETKENAERIQNKEEVNNDESTLKPRETYEDTEEYQKLDQINQTDITEDIIDEERQRRRKQKYAEIYEKIRIRMPFFLQKSSPKIPDEEISQYYVGNSDISNDANKGNSNMNEEFNELKIVNALEMIDDGINQIKFDNMCMEETTSATMSASKQLLIPNKSFIYSENGGLTITNLNVKGDHLKNVTQAVNIILVNNTESEEQKNNVLIQNDNKIKREEYQEPLYEPIELQDQYDHEGRGKKETQQHLIGIKTEANNKGTNIPVTHLEHLDSNKIYNEKLDKKLKDDHDNKALKNFLLDKVEDIYQTVEEALQYSPPNTDTVASPFLSQTKIDQTIDDYEIIEDPVAIKTEIYLKVLKSNTNCSSHSNLSPLTYDGYEECSPQPQTQTQHQPPPLPLPITKDTNAAGKVSANQQSITAVRNTNDELPELPKPKHYAIKTPLPSRQSVGKRSNSTIISISHTHNHYHMSDNDSEENIYDTIKGSHCYESLQPLDNNGNANANDDRDGDGGCDGDAEKAQRLDETSHCDSFSLTSNCYESISHYCPNNVSINTGMKTKGGNGSTLTLLSSDHKTNSLYEDSTSLLNNLLRYNNNNNNSSNNNNNINGALPDNMNAIKNSRNNRISCSSMKYLQRNSLHSFNDGYSNNNNNNNNNNIRSGSSTSSGSIIYVLGSDNSDEWMDITDNERGDEGHPQQHADEEESQPQFIIIRERCKAHKSPIWSKRVREKRLHYQRKSTSCIEDDSDHYYEQLSIHSGNNKRHSLDIEENYKNNGDLHRNRVRISQKGKRHSYSAHALGQTIITTDEYDSFDTDFEEIYENGNGSENENCLKDGDAYNDSGVDMRNIKLPELPSTLTSSVNTHSNTNQMYAIVKRFKNFIVNKKSPNNSKHKIYDNASQFYVMNSTNINNSTLTNEQQMTYSTAKKQATTLTTRLAAATATATKVEYSKSPLNKELSNSEKNLLACQSDITKCEPNNTIAAAMVTATATTPRTKTKPSKSLRARIRKSLVGFDNKPLVTPAPSNTRSTFYVEDLNAISSQHHQLQDDTPGEMDSGFSEKVPLSDSTLSEQASEEITNSQQDQNLQDLQKSSTLRHKIEREVKLSHSQRRRTTIGIRPQDPPPPPPPPSTTERENNGSKTLTRHHQPNTTSWYAECGVFKNGTTTQLTGDEGHFMKSGGKSHHSLSPADNIIACGSSWYEEVGLYQTSGLSEASGSSSGSSGVSTGNDASPNDDLAPSTMFSNEPLYQIYTAAKLEAMSRDMAQTDRDNNLMDGYEEIGNGNNSATDREDTVISDDNRRSLRPSALQLVEPKSGPARTLWCQIPEVINSCILDTMTPRERALMEAKFEIITSEASYMKSLNLLRTHYMNHPIFRDSNHLNSRDRKALFSQIVPVHECSEKLLTNLESCWQDNIMLVGLSRSLYTIAEKHFHVYVGFCENQGRMDRTLKRLRESKGVFSQNLELLESNPTSCGLSLHSFLMLPMQRITRLPLLIDAVFSKCHPNDDEYESWKLCLAIMNKIVTQCNEAANRCEQAYELEKISRQLEFNATVIRPLAIAPVGVTALGAKPRYLVKRGELTHLIWRGDDAKLTFGKKFTKSNIYAFLFSDLLVLTKRKGDEHFSVFDYCPRSMLTISSGDTLPQLPTKDLNSQNNKNLILMTLLENHERKTVEMILSCPSVSEQERWLQAMTPLAAETPGEKLYEQWDCPQVLAKHAYESNEPDLLNLEVGDVINVTRKLPDGWYQGERIRDGAIGWFPGTYTEEVNSAHVRARNLKQRHRLLTFTATYLESQKRHK